MRYAAVAIALPILLSAAADDRLRLSGDPGTAGGTLVSASRLEPKTLNWVVASDAGSREVIAALMADLIHINPQTRKTEPALAKSWTVSPDGLHWVLELRQGLCFSDGHPFDADDVVFTFQVVYDARVTSPQRDLLLLDGKPIIVSKINPYRVAFDLPVARAVADRLFDSVYILPRHKLEAAWKSGKFSDAWRLSAAPGDVVGLGPFRFKSYTPGQQITLERNPHYWKVDAAGASLPYLSGIQFITAGTEDNQVLRFQAGESDVVNRLGARNFAALEKEQRQRGFELRDLGPGLETSLLVFNLANPGFLRSQSFRQAVSAAIDRAAIVRLVYRGRAAALAGPVAPGNRAWVNAKLAPPVRSLERARQLLAADRFQWKDGALCDAGGKPVEFSILVSSSNPERQQMAAMIQDDLKPLGMRVNVIPMDFRSIGARVQQTHQFDTALMALATPDADPNPDLAVYLSSGGNHLWNPRQASPATPWEAEIDSLMRRQQVTLKYTERKRLFDRVQEIMADYLPVAPLVSPNILVGTKTALGNIRPAILEPYVLWNVEQLYWRNGRPAR